MQENHGYVTDTWYVNMNILMHDMQNTTFTVVSTRSKKHLMRMQWFLVTGLYTGGKWQDILIGTTFEWTAEERPAALIPIPTMSRMTCQRENLRGGGWGRGVESGIRPTL